MTTTDLTTEAANIHRQIIGRADLADTTKAQYIRAIDLLIQAGTDPTNPQALQAYADTLPQSGRSFLKAALKLLFQEQILILKGSANAGNLADIQAALLNIDAMTDAIKVTKAKGSKAHTWLTPEQVTDLTTEGLNLSQAIDRRDWILLALLLFGLRVSEACHLPFDKILTIPNDNGHPRPVLEVLGKGSKSRVVPISDLLYKRLLEWKKEAGAGLILRSVDKNGKINHSLSTKSAREIVKNHGKVIGINNLQPHDLRRTYGNILWANTKDIMLVMTMLGHDNPKTTMKYLNLSLDLSRETEKLIPLGE